MNVVILKESTEEGGKGDERGFDDEKKTGVGHDDAALICSSERCRAASRSVFPPL